MQSKTVEVGGVETFVVVDDGAVQVAADEFVTHPHFETDETVVELNSNATFKIIGGFKVFCNDSDVASISGQRENEAIELPSFAGYDYAFKFDNFTIVSEVVEPKDDDEVTVDVGDTTVRIVAEDGELSAEIVDDSFVSYVEEVVGSVRNVVETGESPLDYDAVIVAASSHGGMRVKRWIDTLVNDGGIEVGYVGTVDERNVECENSDMEDEWIGRAMICLDDVRDE